MITILQRLSEQLPQASRTTLRRIIADRRVLVNGLLATSLKEPLSASDVVKILPRRAASEPALPFEIVFQDDDLIVINKPHGLMTSTGPRDRRPTAIGILRAHMKKLDPRAKVGLVHRLDADAAGLLVFSKNAVAHAALKSQFLHHTVERVYLAAVDGIPRPPEGRIDSLLMERADGRVRPTRDRRLGRRAVTHYQTIVARQDQALLRVRLETGRKHQIRVHLAEMNCPIINDVLYNPRAAKGNLALVAVRLELDHPRTGRRMSWEVHKPALAEF